MASLPETLRARRGHGFYPTKGAKVPPLMSQDGKGMDAIVRVHYFVGGCDWYITEWNPETGEAFGWVDLGFGGEMGYMSLPELEAVRVQGWLVVERDMGWKPKPLHEAIKGEK